MGLTKLKKKTSSRHILNWEASPGQTPGFLFWVEVVAICGGDFVWWQGVSAPRSKYVFFGRFGQAETVSDVIQMAEDSGRSHPRDFTSRALVGRRASTPAFAGAGCAQPDESSLIRPSATFSQREMGKSAVAGMRRWMKCEGKRCRNNCCKLAETNIPLLMGRTEKN